MIQIKAGGNTERNDRNFLKGRKFSNNSIITKTKTSGVGWRDGEKMQTIVIE